MTKKCTNTRRNLLQFEFPACKGVGDIIEEIINSRYIGIFTTYWQVIVIENVQLISSDKHCSKNKELSAT